jgi:hypothetical protein
MLDDLNAVGGCKPIFKLSKIIVLGLRGYPSCQPGRYGGPVFPVFLLLTCLPSDIKGRLLEGEEAFFRIEY